MTSVGGESLESIWIAARPRVMMWSVPSKRSYGTGELYEKHGAYYGRWRTSDDRKLNRKIGSVRNPGSSDGLTRAQAERAFRKMQEAEERCPSRRRDVEPVTVGAAATSLRQAKSLEGARKSYLEGLESMQRVHLEPNIAALALEKVSTAQIEALAGGMLDDGLSPKTVRNVLTFTHSVFEHAIAKGWCHENPVRYAARPKRRRARDARPDLQFLTVAELDAVLRAIPDEVVHRAAGTDASRTRRARPAAPARRARARAPGRDPRRGDDRPAPIRAARASLARHRLDRATDQGSKRIRSRRALRRRQV